MNLIIEIYLFLFIIIHKKNNNYFCF
jgi:hypothetical protein